MCFSLWPCDPTRTIATKATSVAMVLMVIVLISNFAAWQSEVSAANYFSSLGTVDSVKYNRNAAFLIFFVHLGRGRRSCGRSRRQY